MRLVALLAAMVVLGAPAPVLAIEETAEGFSAAMQGCWNMIENAENASTQMCLQGGIEGALVVYHCVSHGDLTECSTTEGTYAFRDEKFWRSYVDGGPLAGGLDNCDVRFGPGEKFELRNCAWTKVPEFGGPAVDAVYEKAIGQ